MNCEKCQDKDAMNHYLERELRFLQNKIESLEKIIVKQQTLIDLLYFPSHKGERKHANV